MIVLHIDNCVMSVVVDALANTITLTPKVLRPVPEQLRDGDQQLDGRRRDQRLHVDPGRYRQPMSRAEKGC